jgi:hypothetical protein
MLFSLPVIEDLDVLGNLLNSLRSDAVAPMLNPSFSGYFCTNLYIPSGVTVFVIAYPGYYWLNGILRQYLLGHVQQQHRDNHGLRRWR